MYKKWYKFKSKLAKNKKIIIQHKQYQSKSKQRTNNINLQKKLQINFAQKVSD